MRVLVPSHALPAVHAAQVVGPVVPVAPDVNEIALHVEHSPWPAEPLYLLSAHFVQVVELFVEKVPAVHCCFPEPPGHEYPRGHTEQVVRASGLQLSYGLTPELAGRTGVPLVHGLES